MTFSLRARTLSTSTLGAPKSTPHSAISRASLITLATCSRAFDGMQPRSRHVPPSRGSASTIVDFQAQVGRQERGGISAGPASEHHHLRMHAESLGCAADVAGLIVANPLVYRTAGFPQWAGGRAPQTARGCAGSRDISAACGALTGGESRAIASRCRSAGSSSGHWNRYPASASACGTTRVLDSSRASAISPKASRAANAGMGSTVGRESTRPSVLVNSAFVTGCGAVEIDRAR